MFRITIPVFFLFFGFFSSAQNALDSTRLLNGVTITSNSATSLMPLTFTNLRSADIRQRDIGQDVPYLLKNLPSLVETSDAGAGVGYTYLRIRGTDATRINVTLDGVPLNDAESQAVYWVDVPDFASSTNTIQVQRGVGTSTNGAGAFGATVNMITNPSSEKFLSYKIGLGSFNTQRHTLSAASGLVKNKFMFDARLSYISSDGYVDRAASQLYSFFTSATYLTDKSSLRLKIFGGHEKTYQSWYGIPFSYLTNDSTRRFNQEGSESTPPYKNQTDNYDQTHAHLSFNHQISSDAHFNITLHYTHGVGYYEEYKAAQPVANYTGTKILDTTDIVRRLWLNNDFLGTVFSYNIEKKQFQSITGGGINRYWGASYGTLQSVIGENLAFDANRKYYNSNAVKDDGNIYQKFIYTLFNNQKKKNSADSSSFNLFVDAQLRFVNYAINGVDKNQRDIARNVNYSFFNPKFGFLYGNGTLGNFYGSFGVAHHEPNRNDLTDPSVTDLPTPETLYDTEIGWKKQTDRAQFNVNFFYMNYTNQLVLTGKLNDVGDALRINVPKSYRAGIEMEGAVKLNTRFEVSGNLTLSENKIPVFTESISNWDTYEVTTIQHTNTDIALSPKIISNFGLIYNIIKTEKNDVSIMLNEKYVGQQFLDNTSNTNTALPAYSSTDFHISYAGLINRRKTGIFNDKSISGKPSFQIKISFLNLFDAKYVSNGYASRYTYADSNPTINDPYVRREGNGFINYAAVYPQAGRHFMVSAGIKF